MSQLGMPNVSVAFEQLGIEAIQRSQRSTVLLILEEDGRDMKTGFLTIYSIDDIPNDLSDASKEQIKLAILGYINAPRKVIVYFIPPLTAPEATQDYAPILKIVENVDFVYMAIPQLAAAQAMDIASWVKSMRTVKHRKVQAVLANCAADNEGVINFTNSIVRTAAKDYTAAEYCSRVAGLLAGTPMTISATYAPAPELVEVEAQTDDEMNTRVGRGEFFFFSDGEKIKVGKAVNSFVTTIQGKGDDFKFIKIVNLLDMIHNDIRKTAHDSYIGKYTNNASNRGLLITAINGYFHQLETEKLLETGDNSAYIDIEAVKNWRESKGLNTREELEAMNEDKIKKLNLHDNVFLGAHLSPLNAIENIDLKCFIE